MRTEFLRVFTKSLKFQNGLRAKVTRDWSRLSRGRGTGGTRDRCQKVKLVQSGTNRIFAIKQKTAIKKIRSLSLANTLYLPNSNRRERPATWHGRHLLSPLLTQAEMETLFMRRHNRSPKPAPDAVSFPISHK